MTNRRMARREALMTIVLLAGGALALRAAPVAAQGMDQTGGTTRFVRVAAEVSEFEIEAGRLTAQRSGNVGVRGFAERMTKDHAELLNSLKFTNDSNASAPLPRGLSDEGRHMIDRLRTTSDAGFDVLYMDMQVRSLEEILVVYREYSRVGSVDGLKKYSVKYTPILEEHVRAARTIRGSLTP